MYLDFHSLDLIVSRSPTNEFDTSAIFKGEISIIFGGV